MKKYLKNQEGMALPMVLIIIMILTMLGASLMLYASQSFRSVKYMNAQKQAYYLARVGVESGAYAYQTASLKTSTSDEYNNFDVSNYNGVDAVVSVLQDQVDNDGELVANPGKVTSNKVYVVYSKPSENSGSIWEGLTFVADSATFNSELYEKVIGYFTVESSAATNKIRAEVPKLDENGNEQTDATGSVVTEMKDVDELVVEFRSTAVCYDGGGNEVKKVVNGFVYPIDNPDPTTIANDDGAFRATSPFEHYTQTVNIDEGGTVGSATGGNFIQRIGNFLKRLWNGIVKEVYKAITGNKSFTTNVEIYQYVTGGDLILSEPTQSETYKLPDFKDGSSAYAYAFGTSGRLFLNAGLDATTEKGKYATIGLFGQDIVVNGDIKMAVYINSANKTVDGPIESWLQEIKEKFDSIVATFGNRYRLGTVVIGSGNESGGKYAEYLSISKGGITDENGNTINNANRIFFKGNVTLTVYIQGSTTQTYRIFDAGDVCLFDGGYKNTTGTDGDTTTGIDLMKFFVDSVVDGDPNYSHYGESVRETLSAVREFYYGDQPSYITKSTSGDVIGRPLRVIKVKYDEPNTFLGNMSIDGFDITKPRVIGTEEGKQLDYIKEPVALSASNINWGQPSNSVLNKN